MEFSLPDLDAGITTHPDGTASLWVTIDGEVHKIYSVRAAKAFAAHIIESANMLQAGRLRLGQTLPEDQGTE